MQILAHQVGVDPLGIHELFVLAAAAGGSLLIGLRLYARRFWRRARLCFYSSVGNTTGPVTEFVTTTNYSPSSGSKK